MLQHQKNLNFLSDLKSCHDEREESGGSGEGETWVSRLAIQNEAKIRAEVAEQRGIIRKRHRSGKNEDVEDGLYDSYKFTKLRGVAINGPILRQKSEQLAQQMGYDDFSTTEGWFIAGKFDMDWSGWVQYRMSPKKHMGKQQMPGMKTMSPN